MGGLGAAAGGARRRDHLRPRRRVVPAALAAVARGGVVVCAGIHMSDIPSFPYELLWGERIVRSVANLTRRDAAGVPGARPHRSGPDGGRDVRPRAANEALSKLRAGDVRGALVLVPPAA